MFSLPYLAMILTGMLSPFWYGKARRAWTHLVGQVQPCSISQYLKKWSPADLMTACIIFYLVFLAVRATTVADFANYEAALNKVYLGISYQFLGTGWYWIMNLAVALGLSYASLKGLVVLVSLSLIALTVRHFVKEDTGRLWVWAVYLIFPAILDLVQVRFFLASSIVVFGFRYLREPGWKNSLLYAACIAMAYPIHSAVLIYLLFLLIPLFYKWGLWMKGLFLAGALGGMVFQKQILTAAGYIVGAHRLERYFSSGLGAGKIGLLVYAGFTAGLIAVSWYMASQEPDGKRKKTLNMVEAMNWISLVILPLTLFDANFFRLQRILWTASYIACALYASRPAPIRCFGRSFSVKWILLALAAAANLYLLSLFTFDINLAFFM